jgi:hypothetical protein
MYFMRHHPASKYTLILHQLDWHDQPDKTLKRKNAALALACNGVGATRSPETVVYDGGWAAKDGLIVL